MTGCIRRRKQGRSNQHAGLSCTTPLQWSTGSLLAAGSSDKAKHEGTGNDQLPCAVVLCNVDNGHMFGYLYCALLNEQHRPLASK
jgi:hypothetical protein